MSAGFAVDALVFGVAALLLVGVVSAGVADRLRIPGLLLFLGLGMAIGAEGVGFVDPPDAATAQTVGVVALAIILFEGGLTTAAGVVRRAIAPASALATVGVVLTAGIVAVATYAAFDEIPWNTAFLVGAVVASTDAAAVFAVVRGSPLPRRLAALLEVESGLNDPIAVLLTIGVIESWRAGTDAMDWISFGGVQLLGGLLVGAVCGYLAVRLLLAAPAGADGLLPVAALASAGVAYGLAAWVGASPFLAVYVMGLMVSAHTNLPHRPIRVFHEGLASMAQIALFVTLGLLLDPGRVMAVAGTALLVTAVLLFVARPVAVALCLWPFGFRKGEVAVAGWAGLRGAVPIVLATFALGADHPAGQLVLDIVFFVVVVSTIVQGLTVSPFARRLGLVTEEPPWAALVELVPSDNEHFEIVEVELSAASRVCGRTLGEVPMPSGARVAIVVRDGDALVVHGDTVLRSGDLLVVTAPRDRAVEASLRRWAEGPGTTGGPEGADERTL